MYMYFQNCFKGNLLNNKFKQVFFWNIEYFILNNEIYYEEQYNQIILKLHPIYEINKVRNNPKKIYKSN